MKYLIRAGIFLTGLFAAPVHAQDVLILGEIHDNPAHHAIQAERVAGFAPKAIVFEMLTPGQADHITPDLLKDETALEAALEWSGQGWPAFSMYYPIFTATDAQVFGAAVPRDVARQSMSAGLATAFGEGAALFGLTKPLPEAQQTAREALQAAAHCDALPEDMLAPMVDIQRRRDAALARAVIRATEETGGPVAVITGNGHARKDWGVPAILAQVAPDLDIHVVGQTEDEGALQGGFDEVISSPAHPRPDPCLAFQ